MLVVYYQAGWPQHSQQGKCPISWRKDGNATKPVYLFVAVIRAALSLGTVAVGPALITNSLLLLQNNQRIFWTELLRITMETISHVYKSGANFLCKSHVGSKGTNLCHTMGQQVLASTKHWKYFFLPHHGITPSLKLTPSYVLANYKIKIKVTPFKFCTEKQNNSLVKGKALGTERIQHH